jgi:hypothetical protein
MTCPKHIRVQQEVPTDGGTTFLKRLTKLLEQLQSLIPAILPYFATTAKLPVFKYLNPSIAEDLWPVASILALLASAINFNLSKSTNKQGLALSFCFFGFGAAILSLTIINAIVSRILLQSSPAFQDFIIQVAFIFFFIGIGLASGWTFAKLLVRSR